VTAAIAFLALIFAFVRVAAGSFTDYADQDRYGDDRDYY
jgi:hypothetical protein